MTNPIFSEVRQGYDKAAAGLVFLLAMTGSDPVLAQQGNFSLPAGCTAYLTVQSKDCEVSHHFTCANYEPGVQGRIDIGPDGPSYIGTINAEAQWVSSFDPMMGSTESLAPDPVDAASFSNLLATGSDSYDFMTDNDQSGLTRFVGTDSLSGNTVTIDGITLEETDLDIMVLTEDGTELWRGRGHEYISRDWRMFLSGSGEITSPNETYKYDGSPVEFVFPGEPGFLASLPKFGCGVVSSSATALPSAQ